MKKDTVADRIKALRIENDLTMREFGEKVEVTKAAVQAWENGLNVPTLDKITLLAKEFNVSLDYLAGLADEDMVKITKLDQEQKSIIFTMINYFEKINDNE